MAKKKVKKEADVEQLQVVVESRAKLIIADINDIYENSWNPNKMSKAYMDALKANLSDPNIGFHTPIIVRKHPQFEDSYEIVDGAHRFKAAKEIGYKKIPCTFLGEIPDSLAKYLTLEANAIRGATSDEDQKRILMQIELDEEWKKIMGDFDLWEATVTEPPRDDVKKYALGDDENDPADSQETHPVSMYLTDDQMAYFRHIIGQMRLVHKYTTEEAVIDCIKHFSESTGFGAIPNEDGTQQTMKNNPNVIQMAPGLEDD